MEEPVSNTLKRSNHEEGGRRGAESGVLEHPFLNE